MKSKYLYCVHVLCDGIILLANKLYFYQLSNINPIESQNQSDEMKLVLSDLKFHKFASNEDISKYRLVIL